MKTLLLGFAIVTVLISETSGAYEFRKDLRTKSVAGSLGEMIAKNKVVLALPKNTSTAAPTIAMPKTVGTMQEQLRLGVEYNKPVKRFEFRYKFNSVQIRSETRFGFEEIYFIANGYLCVSGDRVNDGTYPYEKLGLEGGEVEYSNFCGQNSLGGVFQDVRFNFNILEDTVDLDIWYDYGSGSEQDPNGYSTTVAFSISQGSKLSEFVGPSTYSGYLTRIAEVPPTMYLQYVAANGGRHRVMWSIISYERAGLQSAAKDMKICVEIKNSGYCNRQERYISISSQQAADTMNPIGLYTEWGTHIVNLTQDFMLEDYTLDREIIRGGFTIHYISSYGHHVSRSFSGLLW